MLFSIWLSAENASNPSAGFGPSPALYPLFGETCRAAAGIHSDHRARDRASDRPCRGRRPALSCLYIDQQRLPEPFRGQECDQCSKATATGVCSIAPWSRDLSQGVPEKGDWLRAIALLRRRKRLPARCPSPFSTCAAFNPTEGPRRFRGRGVVGVRPFRGTGLHGSSGLREGRSARCGPRAAQR